MVFFLVRFTYLTLFSTPDTELSIANVGATENVYGTQISSNFGYPWRFYRASIPYSWVSKARGFCISIRRLIHPEKYCRWGTCIGCLLTNEWSARCVVWLSWRNYLWRMFVIFSATPYFLSSREWLSSLARRCPSCFLQLEASFLTLASNCEWDRGRVRGLAWLLWNSPRSAVHRTYFWVHQIPSRCPIGACRGAR